MRFFKRISLDQKGAVYLHSTPHQNKTQLHSHLKPRKSNQTCKGVLISNSSGKSLSSLRRLLRKSPSSIDSYSVMYVIKYCSQNSCSAEGKQTHALVLKFGFDPIIFLQTALIRMYSSIGNPVDAHKMFDEIPFKNSIAWTALMSAYIHNQNPKMGLRLFKRMQMGHVKLDGITLTVALSACADLGALEMGQWIHFYILHEKQLTVDLSMSNALIDMYAKCGKIRIARRLYDNAIEKDLTTWTCMIVGHALHGQAKEALKLFTQMKETKNNSLILPNDVTFLGVLMACSHGGMVEEGKKQFRCMIRDYKLKPSISHYGCMVDLFCRAGLLEEACGFILGMKVPQNMVVWRTSLAACGLHGNFELGIKVRRKLMDFEANNDGDQVIMSNIYASNGMWNEKIMVRNRIKKRRDPGCSSIEVGSEINEFVSADNDHVQKNEIYEILQSLIKNIKSYGYED